MKACTTYIYAIREADTGFIKLGVSPDPADRRNSLQIGNPRKLAIVGLAVFTPQLEAELAAICGVEELTGAWFTDTDGLIEAWFKDNAAHSSSGFTAVAMTLPGGEQIRGYVPSGSREAVGVKLQRQTTPINVPAHLWDRYRNLVATGFDPWSVGAGALALMLHCSKDQATQMRAHYLVPPAGNSRPLAPTDR